LVVVFIFQREQYAMRQACFRWLCLLAILFAGPASGAQRIKNIEVAVADPSSTVRSAADIVFPIAEIRKVAPDFTPGALIMTVTDRSTLEEEAAVLQTEELPSQVDDLDGDGQADELAFQVDLAALRSQIVTISCGTGIASGACVAITSREPRRFSAVLENLLGLQQHTRPAPLAQK
jgi:hypothetical protein